MEESILNKQYQIAQTTKDTIAIKTAVSAFATLLMMLLCILNLNTIILSISSIVLSLVIYGVCIQEFNDALISVFKLNPSNDTFNAIALILSIIHAISLFFSNNVNLHYFTPIVFLSISISMVMKLLFVSEIITNLNIIKKNDMHIVNVAKTNLVKRYIRKVCMINPIVEFPDVISISYSNDPSEEKSKAFVPIICGFVLVLSLIIMLISGANMFFTSLAALFAICASFAGEMTFVLPYIVAQHRLRRLGSLLLGYHSILSLRDIDTLLVLDTELFPQKLATLEQVRFKNTEYISESIEYTAALLSKINSPAKTVFLQLLDFDPSKLAPPEDFRCLKGYGISAIINGDSVLLGNRNLLLSYDIPPLPQEKEAMLRSSNSSSVLYCAINGELAATFLFQYICDPAMKKAAEHVGGDFNIIVESDDCNVTETMIKKQYDMPNTKIIVPDNDEADVINNIRSNISEDINTPVMLSVQNSMGIIESVRQAKTLSGILDYCILTRHISIAVGIILTFIALIVLPSQVGPIWIFIFNILWALPVVLLAFLKRK